MKFIGIKSDILEFVTLQGNLNEVILFFNLICSKTCPIKILIRKIKKINKTVKLRLEFCAHPKLNIQLKKSAMKLHFIEIRNDEYFQGIGTSTF